MKAEDVRAQHPDVYDAIFESGAKSVRGTADAEKKEAVDTAVAERTTEILALVGAVTGQDASAKLAAMIEAGVTAKQLEAMKSAGVLGAGHYDFTSRQQILDGLNAAQSQAVGQAAGDGKAGNPAVEFDARVDDYMRVNGVKRGEAMDKVGAEHPKLREAWLKSKQAE